MPFNGSGTFTRIYNWVIDKANGINITASRMDADLDDIANGLSQCINKNGQTILTANIPFNNYKITGLNNGAERNDSINVGQVQDNQFSYLGTTSGSADAYTLSPAPTITAYATTQQFVAKIHATNATTTPYLQISGIANPASTAVIKKLNASRAEVAVEASDLLANGIYKFQRNSANDAWIVLNPEKPFINLLNGTKATTTNQGIIEIATNAEIQAATDTERAIVPSALASLFAASSRASSGYARIPVKVSGAFVEIIIQWAVGTFSAAGAANSFPIAFPTAVLGVYLGNTDTVSTIFGTGSITLSGFTGSKNGSGSAGTFYLAIGY